MIFQFIFKTLFLDYDKFYFKKNKLLINKHMLFPQKKIKEMRVLPKEIRFFIP